uniref:Uncharacterized protein n=1 Tax=Setaria viridis TaxID=4556 RepID=A0A4U6T037_SETVI|nr:hypothetical protein SEVIR_9G281700v2 [Setaria viridis]
MPRTVSRSPPPFRRRRSPSPRYTSRRNRRDRSRSPYSSRRKTRSPSPLWDRSNSPTPRRHRSPPSPRRHIRRRSRSTTSSFVNNSCSPSRGSEQINLSEKHKMEVEEKKRSKKEERERSWIECLKRTGVKWRRLKEKKLLSSSRKSWSDIWSWKGYKSKEKKLYAERKWRRKKRELMS